MQRSLRESIGAQILLCTALGIAVGLVTVLLHRLTLFLHRLSFGLRPGEHLSNAAHIHPLRIVVVCVAGGALLGTFLLAMSRRRSWEIVDPIEANAIHGGRMSVSDSLRLVAATFLSNGAGASLGMEAGYTQIGASVTSWVGKQLKLSRQDMRVLVAGGAGAAIAAAFNAPLAGAFYGFELVLGNYTVAALPQVALCVLAATLFMRMVTPAEPIFTLPLDIPSIPLWLYPYFIIMGIGAGAWGIGTMKLVTRCEHAIRLVPLPQWLQPACGGLALATVALAFPQVLGSGQGAIDNHLHHHWPTLALLGLLGAKTMASAVSIGSGFRGGLFSSSLLIGCVFGQLCGSFAGYLLPQTDSQRESFMLVGMGAVSASIVGAPITMVLLVLEMTGNYPATTAVLAGALFSSTTTRHFFGYSFSTWRFHMRGLRITGAFDIGWVNELTMETLMQKDTKTIPASMTLAELRAQIPPGSAQGIFAIDSGGRYSGIVDITTAHSVELDDRIVTVTAADLAKAKAFFLLPRQNIQQALELFAASEQEELPVLDSAENRRVVGHVSASRMLRRYAHELEARNMAESGAAASREV